MDRHSSVFCCPTRAPRREPSGAVGAVRQPRFLAFFDSELKPWILGQAAAIGDLCLQGSKLSGYGKAVAALAAGAADLRFVDLARDVRCPKR